MQSAWLSRLFFAVVAAIAIAGVVSGTACTRWGKPGPVPPTIAPLSALYVDPHTGSDTSGNGSAAKPYKTLTKAVAVLAASKNRSQSGVTINLATGDYVAANGEKFPIVVPTNVTINGTNFGMGPANGTFIDGVGQDTIFEQLVHAPARTAYTTLEVIPPANVNLGGVYVGATKISLPSSHAGYTSLDVIGAVNGATSAYGAGIVTALKNVSGVIVTGGSFNCSSCQIQGNDFGIGALAAPIATSSPGAGIPTITLSHASSDSTVAAKVVDIVTDGSANVTVSGESFQRSQYAFADALRPVIPRPAPGAIDFGGGVGGSTGQNTFIGAGITEIWVTRRSEAVDALDDTWNPNQQGANRNGKYPQNLTFKPGAKGKNVTILGSALGSQVFVGPAPVPTPTPTASPTASP